MQRSRQHTGPGRIMRSAAIGLILISMLFCTTGADCDSTRFRGALGSAILENGFQNFYLSVTEALIAAYWADEVDEYRSGG